LACATVDLDLSRDPAHRVQAVHDARHDEDGALLTAEELHAFLDAARTVAPHWHALLSTLAFTAIFELAPAGRATAAACRVVAPVSTLLMTKLWPSLPTRVPKP
jgi:hypothetical protein